MSHKQIITTSIMAMLILGFSCQGNAEPVRSNHPVYLGFNLGYGSTTWKGLVPPQDKQNDATSMSTPIHATEGGGTWGFLVGYEFIPAFAIEASYNHYPTAHITFDDMSLFTFEHDGATRLTTHTETAALLAKVMFYIPRTTIRAFSGAGAAGVHRYDEVTDRWRLSPTFAAGFTYDLNEHFIAELGANYTSGYGQSELRPAEDYVPFIYSVFLQMAYRI